MKRYAATASIIIFFVLSSYFPAFGQEQPVQGRATQDQPEGQPGKISPREFPPRLEKILNLTPEQKTKLDEFRKARQEQRRAFFDQMKKLRTEFREAMKAPQADEKKIDGLVDDMATLRSSHLKSCLRSAREMKKILTPEQLEKLEKIKTRMAARREAWGRRRFWHRPHREFGWNRML